MFVTVLTSVLLMTYAHAMTRRETNKVRITKFDNYPGLYFDNLGFTNLITNEWKLACQNARFDGDHKGGQFTTHSMEDR